MKKTVVRAMFLALAVSAALAGHAQNVETRAAVQSLSGHLDNLALLSRVPAPAAVPLPAVLPPVPARSLAATPAAELAGEYLRQIDPVQPAERAAAKILATVAAHPELAPKLRPHLERAHPDGRAAADRLERWAAAQTTAENAHGGSADEAWSRLTAIFEGSPASAADADPSPAAAPSPERLTARPHAPMPSAENLRAWYGQPGDRVGWVFRGIDPRLNESLFGTPEPPAPSHEPADASRGRGPPAAIDDVTMGVYQLRTANEGEFTESFGSLPELMNAYRERGLKDPALRDVVSYTVRNRRRYSVIHGPATLDALAAAPKSQDAGRAELSRRGHVLTLRVTSADDLGALARKYAAGRDPRALERFLQAKLRGRDAVELPLQSLLPRFIRRTLDRFENCTGPNCIAAALSVRGSADYPDSHRYDEGTMMMARLTGPEYREVLDGSLAAGDVLIYSDLNGEFVHAAVSVDDGYVFTKNGLGRYYPYVFQTQAQVEAVFFPVGEFKRRVFRPNGPKAD